MSDARVVYCLLGAQCALCWWRNTGQYAVPLTGEQWARLVGPHVRGGEERAD